jgi:NAD(P)-dependent dehydrogenase (short-subunit alcohol dehydrogenase family)
VASKFQPNLPPPPSLGSPVFPNVDLSVRLSLPRNSDPDSVFVVTGASRGIGLQAVKSLLGRTQGTVVACCRQPSAAPSLSQLAHDLVEVDQRHRLRVVELDLEDQASVARAGGEIREMVAAGIGGGGGGTIDAVFHVAGVLGDNRESTPGPERSLSHLNRSWLEKSMAVHVVGPMMLNRELFPLLKRPSRRRAAEESDCSSVEAASSPSSRSPPTNSSRPPSVVVHMSARVGSISDNQLGGWYSYRMSKAALNQAVRTMAHEGKRHGILCVSYHPGTTQTDLSAPFASNVSPERLFPVEYSADRMLDVADAVTQAHSGGLYDWSGRCIPF